MTEEKKDLALINAYPTKELFISMLVRDVSLRDAIGDLLDNSVDGALRVRGDSSYTGLWIKIEFDVKKDYFRISDNCGGIPVKVAREYVFCFGRPEGAEDTDHSIGAFGIGMKRALFRLGNNFTVKSISKNSSFDMDVDVDKWRQGIKNADDQAEESEKQTDWTFEFNEFEEDLEEENPEEERGTVITINNLHQTVKAAFNNDNDLSELIQELQREHIFSIYNGLEITLNGVQLEAPDLKLIETTDLRPAYWENLDDSVKIRIYAGVSEQTEYGVDGGWYVFCNKRLVLGPDKTYRTGWGIESPIRIPEYHSQFYKFRGYVFLDAEDPKDLPWNTAKTSMDLDSPVWRTVFQQMVLLMRSVIDFLNDIKKEKGQFREEKINETPLQSAIERAEFVSISDILQSDKKQPREESKFVAPEPAKPKKQRTPDKVWIRFAISKDEYDQVNEYFDGINKPADIAHNIFDYFFKREIDG